MSSKPSCKKCFQTTIAIFIAVAVVDMFINAVCLKGQYEATKSYWRGEERMKTLFPCIFLGYAAFAYFFTWIYTKGYEPEKPGLGQGIRFALLLWPVAVLAGQLSFVPFLNVPLRFFGFWSATGLIDCLVAGFVAGLIYKTEA